MIRTFNGLIIKNVFADLFSRKTFPVHDNNSEKIRKLDVTDEIDQEYFSSDEARKIKVICALSEKLSFKNQPNATACIIKA